LKRSEINVIMEDCRKFLKEMKFHLPAFADWTPEEWTRKGKECSEIVENQLGWDITDFGSNDFHSRGLFLFTIRNGNFKLAEQNIGKNYAEKIMIVEEEQLTPNHFHFIKMEDIINRGGGNLLLQFWNATEDEKLAESDVQISVDGVVVDLKPGEILRLKPGESVTIPQKIYHCFYGEKGKGKVLVGEVSGVSDDYIDDRFFEELARFPGIEEDEKPKFLLYDDYVKYYKE